MAIYDSSALGTANNLITFNDFENSPLYRVIRRAPTRREVREFDIALPEHTGVADFQTFIGKTYFIIDGIMYPNDTDEFYEGRRVLRKLGSLAFEQDDALSDDGYVPYVFTEDITKQMFVKVLYVDMQEATRQGIVQPFRILCKVKYPVIFGYSTIQTLLGDSTATTSGSSNLPFTLPHAIGLTTYSSNGTLNNTGDLATFPTITVYGPVTTPRITNSTTGEYIEVGVTLATSSDSLIITYDQDSLSFTQAGNTVLSNLTSTSTLFKLRTGTNNLSFSGATVGAGAYATVSTYPAWSLS